MPNRASERAAGTRPSRGVHAVGLTAAGLGVLAFALLPFATYRTSRIQTGDDLSTLEALGPGWSLALLALWVLLAALSLRNDRRRLLATSRGVVASCALAGTVALTAVAAERLLTAAEPYARVSAGMGAWLAVVAGYMVILASRRELGPRSPGAVALTVLAPGAVVVMLLSGALSSTGMMQEYASQSERFWAEVAAHVAYSAIAMTVAVVVGMGLGVLAFRRPRVKRPVFAVVSVFQTIPGLAMVGLLFAPLSWLGANVPALERIGVGGLGWAPVIVALTLYALLAVVRNTHAGLEGVPPDVVEAAFGVGMTEGQVMRRVRFPLAVPALFGGTRTATVQTIGNATLGAFVAAGTLGLFVFGGLSQQAIDLIMLASLGIVVMALIADGGLRIVQRAVTPGREESGGVGER